MSTLKADQNDQTTTVLAVGYQLYATLFLPKRNITHTHTYTHI